MRPPQNSSYGPSWLMQFQTDLTSLEHFFSRDTSYPQNVSTRWILRGDLRRGTAVFFENGKNFKLLSKKDCKKIFIFSCINYPCLFTFQKSYTIISLWYWTPADLHHTYPSTSRSQGLQSSHLVEM